MPFVFHRFVRGTRGSAPIQAIILLAVALAILLGLRSVFPATVSQVGGHPIGSGAGTEANGGPKTPAMVVSRPALNPEAAAAQRRLDELPNLELMRDLADLAYHEVGTEQFNDLMKKFDPAWNVQFYDVPQTGLKIAFLTAKDPNDKRVLVGLGGTEGADPRHWVVNFGQHLPAISMEQALADVGKGTVVAGMTGSIKGIVLTTVGYGLSTLARTEYEGLNQLGATLKNRYGAENVFVAGHSKGGAEGTFMGAMNGLRTYTFNAAGMSEASLDLIRQSGVPNPEKYVTNVVGQGEILNRVDVLGTKIGEVITVESKEQGWGASLKNHKLGNILIDKPVRYQPAKPLPR